MSRHLGWRLVAVLAVLGAASWMVATRPARLGLDLRGGTQIVLEAKDGPERRVDGDTLARTLEVLRRRVDQLGVAEPTLQRSGDRRVIVELPGVYDPKEATEVIGRTAQLAFHPVIGVAEPAPEEPARGSRPAGEDGLVLADEGGGRLRLGAAALIGEAVGDARAELDPQFQTRWQVTIEFQGAGGRRWAELTGQAACQPAGDPRRRVAIVLDRQIISSPQVDPSVACEHGITGGQTAITGDFSGGEAQDLALLIRAGALPVPVEVVEQRTVGPTLGEAAIRASVQAAVVGAALTILYMMAYYRLLGGLAAVALLAAGLLFFLASGAVRGFGVTLSIGVLVSLFTALVVTRGLVELTARVDAVRRRPRLLGVEGGRRLGRWLASRGPDLIARGRWWLAGSLAALLLAGAGLVVRGPNFGVEFTGGRLLEYGTARSVDLDAARRVLADAGFPRAVVQASGDGDLTVRTGQLDEAGQDRIQRAVATLGGQATELRDEFIGPTIGAELRRKALIAIGIALVVQLGYLAIRFRWTFGAAAVLAMFHDVAILLGLFAWLGKPLDGVFLAALFVLGGDILTGFALALLVGIGVGTWSSMFVAAPLLVAFEQRSGRPPTTAPKSDDPVRPPPEDRRRGRRHAAPYKPRAGSRA